MNNKEISFNFKLPDFERKNIKVKVTKNSLSVNAEKKEQKKVQKKDYYHEEKSQRTFNYITTLPNVKHNQAKVSFEKGILKIKAPRM